MSNRRRSENDDNSFPQFLLAGCRYPARLNQQDAASLLGFAVSDIPVLVSQKLLKPLGRPVQNSTKYFAAIQVASLAENPDWLSKATQVVYDFWRGKNAKKKAAFSLPSEEDAIAA